MTIYGDYWWVQWRPGGLYWAQRAAGDDNPSREGECPDWESLPAPPGARLALSVPGDGVRIHTVSVPTRPRRRFLAALPFALEDQLFLPQETYHFVPLPQAADRSSTPVAVVERDRMTRWVKEVEQRGWRLEMLIPEYLSIPEPEPGAWLLDGTATPLLLRFPETAGGAALNSGIESQPPGALLLALEQAPQLPRRLEVRVRDQEQRERVGNWQSRLGDFDIELEQFEADLSRPAWLARQPLPARSCNLLTGSYKPGKERLLQARRFIPATGLAAALIVVLAAQWLLENARIRAEHERLTQAIEATYREAFPDAGNLVEPRHQMEQRLIAMGRPPGDRDQAQTDVLAWLERLAPFTGAGTDLRLRAFSFDDRRIVLELSLPDFEALEDLQQQLAESMRVNVENVELRDGRVHSRIHLERQA